MRLWNLEWIVEKFDRTFMLDGASFEDRMRLEGGRGGFETG